MGIVIERWVFCDRCDPTSRDGDVLYKSTEAMVEDLTRYSGWDINIRTDKCVCPDCKGEQNVH